MGVTIESRSYYSIGWLQAADLMRAQALEAGVGDDRPDSATVTAMQSYVLSAIAASVAFLEAYANELFDDAHRYLREPGHKGLRGLDNETQIRMAALWPYIKKYRILEKFSIALGLATAETIQPGDEPFQSAKLLIRIRNHYIHYQPDSVHDGVAQGEDQRLSRALEYRIAVPTWDTSTNDLFPTRALCPDMSRWAVQAAVAFADEFSKRLGVVAGYAHVRPGWLN